MELVQVRLPKGLIQDLNKIVKKGHYVNKSDVIRDAIRKLSLLTSIEKQIGTIPNTGDSVQEVREIRKKLSKDEFNIDEINKL